MNYILKRLLPEKVSFRNIGMQGINEADRLVPRLDSSSTNSSEATNQNKNSLFSKLKKGAGCLLCIFPSRAKGNPSEISSTTSLAESSKRTADTADKADITTPKATKQEMHGVETSAPECSEEKASPPKAKLQVLGYDDDDSSSMLVVPKKSHSEKKGSTTDISTISQIEDELNKELNAETALIEENSFKNALEEEYEKLLSRTAILEFLEAEKN